MREVEAKLGCFFCKFYTEKYRIIRDPEKGDGIMMIVCERDKCITDRDNSIWEVREYIEDNDGCGPFANDRRVLLHTYCFTTKEEAEQYVRDHPLPRHKFYSIKEKIEQTP